MSISSLAFDPESRAPAWQAAVRLPLLLYRLVRWRALRGGWLPDHLRRHHRFDRSELPLDTPIDVIVAVADHYEPARCHGDEAAVESVRSWCAGYEQMVREHRDADGRVPQHTWFYRFDYPNAGCLHALSEAAFRGLGEVEFHLHHAYDTHASYAGKLQAGLEWFSRYGAMHTAESNPRHLFSYVAGNSALDNGCGNNALSGCNTELAALRDAGCYADFTFPALGTAAQPKTTNTIYYASEDGRAKSYDSGVPVAVGRPSSGDLMIFQGPTSFNWADGFVDDGMLENSSPAHPRRLACWLSAHVHIPGRPEWVFIKLSTHGMQNRASFLSASTEAMFAAMEHWWNRPPFRLHYVTAREVYNIVKAAEAGHQGNPNDYRDFLVARPTNRLLACNRPWRLLTWSPRRLHVRVLEEGDVRLDFAEGPLHLVTGRLKEVEILNMGVGRCEDGVAGEGRQALVRVRSEGPFELTGRDGTTCTAAEEVICWPRSRQTVPLGQG
jgi:hypothetical protein